VSQTSTAIKEDTQNLAESSSLLGRRREHTLYRIPAIAILAMAIPSSANVQIIDPTLAINQSRVSIVWRRRDDQDTEMEVYSPFYTSGWMDTAPLIVKRVGLMQARLRFLGKLRFEPIQGEF